MISIGIIGTAGRDYRIRNYTRKLYDSMVEAVTSAIIGLNPDDKDVCLVSGGAAWADHVAVTLFLDAFSPSPTATAPITGCRIKGIKLHLPARMTSGVGEGLRFAAPSTPRTGGPSAASIANRYHRRFSRTLNNGRWTMGEIARIIDISDHHPTVSTSFSDIDGVEAFRERNIEVARDSTHGLIALTFSDSDDYPRRGSGTEHTWHNHILLHGGRSLRVHQNLHALRA